MRPASLRATAGAFLMLGLIAGPLGAQLRWSKAPSNPVMVRAASFFEGLAIGQPALLEEDGVLRLWFAAAGLDHRGRILAARSTDGGLTWQRENGGWPVLDVGLPASWDSHWLDTPEVVHDDSGYKLYYYGATSNDSTGASIGLAISSDGLHFTRPGPDPVLRPGPEGSWDERWVESPAVLRLPQAGSYLMWYTGVDAGWRVRVGLATSPDGIVWTKHPDNPVLDLGAPGGWEDAWAGVPGVIRWRTGFLMAYSGVSAADLADGAADHIGLGLAFSADGIVWRRFSGNPVLTTTSPPHEPGVDAGGPWAPGLAWDPRTRRLLMLYESAAGLNLAVSLPPLARRPTHRALGSPGAARGR